MLSLSIQHIRFIECLHLCIVLQVSISTSPVGDMRMLQAFLHHHQIYFLLLVLNLIFCFNMSGTLIHYIKQCNHSLKLSFHCFITCTVFNTTCCIKIGSFSATSEAVILVAIYIVPCLQNKYL